MSRQSFGRSIIYGLLVSLAWIPTAWVLAPRLGTRNGFLLYVGLAVSLYVFGIARSRAR